MIKWILFLFIMAEITSSQELSYTNAASHLMIPELFNGARQEMAQTSTDLYLGITVPFLFSMSTTTSMDYSVSNFKAGSGTLSFYGTDTYSQYDNKWKHNLNKLFFKKVINNFSIDAGIGYDYNKSSHFYSNSDSSISNSISGYIDHLSIERLTHNTFYSNVNSLINIDAASSLIAGFDCTYTRIRGFSFQETYQRTYKTVADYSDKIDYNHYCGNDYYYHHSAGVGLLRKFTSKTNQKKASVFYTKWKFHYNHLMSELIDTVSSFYQNKPPQVIAFSGIANKINKFSLNYLSINTLSDSIGVYHPLLFKIPWCQHSMDILQLSITYVDSRYLDKDFYRDNRDSVSNFYGSLKKSSSQSLSFSLECMPELFFFKKFYCNLYSFFTYSPPINEKYHLLKLALYPGIGTKFSLLNTYLFDLNIAPAKITMTTDFSSGFDLWYTQPAIRLRIAVLR